MISAYLDPNIAASAWLIFLAIAGLFIVAIAT
jgi:hypothetical protein